jgi:hypothetical protein
MNTGKQCDHIAVTKISGRPAFARCQNLATRKGMTADGRGTFVCTTHAPIYPPRPKPRK